MKGGVHHVIMLIKWKVKRKGKEVSIFCPRTKCQQVSSSSAWLRTYKERFRNKCGPPCISAYRLAPHLGAQNCNGAPPFWEAKWLDLCTCKRIPELIIPAQSQGCESKCPFDASHNEPMIRELSPYLLRQSDACWMGSNLGAIYCSVCLASGAVVSATSSSYLAIT
jgi:hypothetical protein